MLQGMHTFISYVQGIVDELMTYINDQLAIEIPKKMGTHVHKLTSP